MWFTESIRLMPSGSMLAAIYPHFTTPPLFPRASRSVFPKPTRALLATMPPQLWAITTTSLPESPMAELIMEWTIAMSAERSVVGVVLPTEASWRACVVYPRACSSVVRREKSEGVCQAPGMRTSCGFVIIVVFENVIGRGAVCDANRSADCSNLKGSQSR